MYEHPCGFYAGPNVEWAAAGNITSTSQKRSSPIRTRCSASRSATAASAGFSVFLEAKNLTNKRYAATTNVIVDARGQDSAEFYPGDGRSFYGGVEWKW